MITDWLNANTGAVADALDKNGVLSEMSGGFGMKQRVVDFITAVRTAMYPNLYLEHPVRGEFIHAVRTNQLRSAAMLLFELGYDVYLSRGETPASASEKSEAVTRAFIDGVPEIAEVLATDIHAAYEGDPAAVSEEEIMLAYPAFEAISIFRLAHKLYTLRLPLIPRMMTEHAHTLTGIDIHPGATIGPHFFIDHGTGVVIGETCVIGERVKLYQGVTLGAKSFENDENGNPIKGIKRHPNIGNNVVIYAGATILGGDTFIGDNCVIGGNVWLTHSVAAGEIVYNWK